MEQERAFNNKIDLEKELLKEEQELLKDPFYKGETDKNSKSGAKPKETKRKKKIIKQSKKINRNK